MAAEPGFDRTHDVVVLGSGCAGMMSALAAADQGADVALFEKADVLGGTTALSSGVAWLPANRYQAEHGVVDSPDEGRDYLTALSNGLIRPEFTDAFVSTVDEMLEWTEERTPLRMRLVPGYPDYHPEFPAGSPVAGARPEPTLFSFDESGEWADRFLGVRRSMYVAETPVGVGRASSRPRRTSAEPRSVLEGLGRGAARRAVQGPARPRRPGGDGGRGDAPGHRGRSGRRRRVRRRHPGRRPSRGRAGHRRVRARPGLVTAFLRGPLGHSPGAPTNTGDGLRMAMRVGAGLGVMREAWWVPVVAIPGFEGEQYSGHGIQAGPARAHPAAHHHGQRRGPTVHQRGRQLQRPRRGLPRLPSDPLRLREPARVDRLRPGLPGLVRRLRRPAGRPRAGLARPGGHARGALPSGSAYPRTRMRSTVDRWNEVSDGGRDVDHGRGDSAYDGVVRRPGRLPPGRCPPSAGSTGRRTSPRRSTPAASAPRAVPAPPWTARCSTWRALPSPAMGGRQRDGRPHWDGLRRRGRHPRAGDGLRPSLREVRGCGVMVDM